MFKNIKSASHRFLKSSTANVASMFAIAALPLIGATGAAVDYSRAYEQRMVVQDALDAAALAATKLIGTRTTAEIRAEAEAFYIANTSGKFDNPPDFEMAITGGQVTLTTRLEVPTTILGVMGIDEIAFDILSRTVAGSATYEIALVLDTSTSMAGTKITTLQTAATNLINTIYQVNVSNPKPDPVKFSIVPFSAAVNVGTANETAAWMGGGAETAARSENFWHYAANGVTKLPLLTSRFDLFDDLGVDWQGCVEERAIPYDANDAPASAATPDTMFIPMFAPDEPDDDFCAWEQVTRRVNRRNVTTTEWVCEGQSYDDFANDYLSDYGGARGQVAYVNRQEAQANVAKYDRGSIRSGFTGTGKGPNRNCTAKPIMALNTSQATAIAKVATLQANGYTNIMAGLAWGWRVLSPTAPFTEGRPYETVGNNKILILMTDGANTYNMESNSGNFNNSDYMARNYIANNHLGTTSRTESTVVTQINARTMAACQNIKTQGDIIVYTIAFQMANEPGARAILADCASDPTKAYDSRSNADLLVAFRTIAEDISTLRIAQ